MVQTDMPAGYHPELWALVTPLRDAASERGRAQKAAAPARPASPPRSGSCPRAALPQLKIHLSMRLRIRHYLEQRDQPYIG